MRKLSCWAREHAFAAQVLIFLSHVLLILTGIYLGIQLSSAFRISPLLLYLLTALLLLLFLFYPHQIHRQNYGRRKLLDLLAGVLSFLLVMATVAQLNRAASPWQKPLYAALPAEMPVYKNPEAKVLLEQFERGEKTSFSWKEKRILKKEFKFQLLQYGKAYIRGDKPAADQTGLIILAIIGAVGLLFLVASLACTLSCNGADGAAAIVFILGLAGIIWGLVAIIRSIKRKRAASPA